MDPRPTHNMAHAPPLVGRDRKVVMHCVPEQVNKGSVHSDQTEPRYSNNTLLRTHSLEAMLV